MSNWSQIKSTEEYRKAKREVEDMITRRIAPLEAELRNLRSELIALRSRFG
jgi:hypothetical protein